MARRRSSFLTDIRRANRDLRTLNAIAQSMKPRGKSSFYAFGLYICFFPLALHNFYAGRVKLAIFEVACFLLAFGLLYVDYREPARYVGYLWLGLLVWDIFTLGIAVDKYNERHPQ